MPASTWQRRVAESWLVRLRFEVPADAEPEVMELSMETREWFQKWVEDHDREVVREHERVWEQKVQRTVLDLTLTMCEMRLTRPPTEAERAALEERCRRLGPERVSSMISTRSADDLAAWLADPHG